MDQDRFDVFVGLDVGKEHHHATALNSAGRRLHDKALPQDEAALREVFDKLAGYGSVLVIVDQPATIGALPVTGGSRDGYRGRLSARAGDAPHR